MIVSGTAVRIVHRRLGGRHRRRAVAVLDDEVDRHLAFETADVSVTEVVAQLVHLPTRYTHNAVKVKYTPICIAHRRNYL